MHTQPRFAVAQAYKKVDTYSGVEDADSHRLIELLLTGALTHIATAKGHIARRKIGEKCTSISKTIAILDGLRASLNTDLGGDIAENLDNLYEYMQRRLALANVDDNPSILDEVTSLIGEIKGAWASIRVEVRKGAESS